MHRGHAPCWRRRTASCVLEKGAVGVRARRRAGDAPAAPPSSTGPPRTSADRGSPAVPGRRSGVVWAAARAPPKPRHARSSAADRSDPLAWLPSRAEPWSDMTASTGTRALTTPTGEADFKVADLSLAGFGRKEIQPRRARDARPDGAARGVRRRAAARRRPHRRLAAHDRADRRPHRDPDRARRRRPLGQLQHLLHPGPRRRGDRRRRAAPPRSPPASRSSPGRARRWRSTGGAPSGCSSSATSDGEVVGPNMLLDDGGDATLLVHLGTRFEADGAVPDTTDADSEEYGVILDVLRGTLAEDTRLLDPHRPGHQGRHRGDHHRRHAALRARPRRPAAVPGDQRQRLGHQEQVRQPLRLPALADRRHQPRHRRDDRRQGRRRLRLRRRRQGLRGVAARPGRPRDRHRDRPDLRAAGGDARLRGDHARRGDRQGRHHHHHDRQQGHHLGRAARPRPSTRRSSATSATSTTRSTWPAWPAPRASRGRRSSRRSTSGGSPTATRSSCSPRAGC